MTPICDTLDRMIIMLSMTIKYVDDPEIVEEAKQDKHNLELIRDHMIRKVGE